MESLNLLDPLLCGGSGRDALSSVSVNAEQKWYQPVL
jgi:hypothetical protein